MRSIFNRKFPNKIHALETFLSLAMLTLKVVPTPIEEEISENSPFVFTAIDLTTSTDKIRNLLFNATNQTLVLKAIEALKERNNLTQNDKISALKLVTDINIKNIINAI